MTRVEQWPAQRSLQGVAKQAKLDEILRALDKARSEFVGIEHLTDAQICEIRDAMEREIKGEHEDQGKQATTGRTVQSFLSRY